MVNFSHILFSSSGLILDKNEQLKAKLPPLRIGQIVDAKVLNILSSKEAKLSFLGKHITVKTHTPLRLGDEIKLKVVQSEETQVLKLVGLKGQKTETSMAHRLASFRKEGPFSFLSKVMAQLEGASEEKQNIQKYNNLSYSDLDRSNTNDLDVKLDDLRPSGLKKSSVRSLAIVKDVKQAIHMMTLKSEVADPDLVRNIIKFSGLSWENKLSSLIGLEKEDINELKQMLVSKDLKASLLRFISESNQSEGIVQDVHKVLEQVETLQLANKVAVDEQGRYLLPLPYLWNNNLKFGQLLFDLGAKQDKNSGKKDRLIRVSFLLNLSNLGDMLAEFSILKKSVSGVFGFGDRDVCQFVQRYLPELKSKLTAHGFNVHDINCQLMRPETLTSTSLVDKLGPIKDGVLNVII